MIRHAKSGVKSPCEDICKLDEFGICVGCYRSAEEIKKWRSYTDEEKLQVIENCKIRRNNENDNYDRYA